MNKKIFIVPYGGLGNRMRVIASAVYFSRQQNIPIEINWFKEKDFVAKFNDIFEEINISNITIKDSSWLNLFNARAKKSNFFLPYLIRSIFSIKQYSDFKQLNEKPHLKPKNIYISTSSSTGKHFPINEIFIPKNDILIELKRITDKFSKNTIGIHIRRKDNVESIKKSKIEIFIRKIEEEISLNNQTLFYVASDDYTVIEELKIKYPNNILFNERAILNRNTLNGIKDSIVDLWALSKTNKIIGSYYSSFSEIASELGRIPLIIAKD